MSAVLRHGVDEESPWPGLFPYSEESSRFFNGRERETGELLRLVKRDTLCLLYGQSGLGKSSLIQAGVFPRLRQEALLPVYLRLDYASRDLDLRAQFWRVFREVLDAQRIDARRPRPQESLWEYFNDATLEFWDARNRALTPVLVFDQFEEVFTTGDARGAAPAEGGFLRELGDLIDARVPDVVRGLLEADPDAASRYHFGSPRFRVLIGFREDFLPEFEDLFRALRLPAGSRLRLTRMREEQALEAVRRTGGRLVDGEVAAQIVAFVSGRESAIRVRSAEVEPALLSVVCYELNNRRRSRGEPLISSALLSGAREQIIEEFYHRSLAGVAAPVREFIEEELLTDSGYRDSAAIDDALKRPGVSDAAIRDLVEKRVVRLEERFGVLRIELTHDILAPVVRRDRDERQERQRLEAERERERVRQRRSRRLTQVVATGLVAAIALVAVFAVLLKRAEEEKSRAIQAQSSLFLARGVSGLEQNVPREPYKSLAQAIALDPQNRAASARAVSLLTQRRFPGLELALPLNANAVRFLGETADGRLALSRDGVVMLLGATGAGAGAEGVQVTCVREELATGTADPFVRLAPVARRPGGSDEDGGRSDASRLDAAAWGTVLAQAKSSCAKPAPPAKGKAEGQGGTGPAPVAQAYARRVGFDPETAVAVYANAKAELLVIDAAGERETVALGPEASPVVGVALDPARHRLVVAFDNGEVALRWLAGERGGRKAIVRAAADGKAQGTVSRLQFSPGGEHLLVVGSGTSPEMQLWRLKDGRRLAAAKLDYAEAAWFSPGGDWLARVVQGAVEFVDPATGAVSGRVARSLAFNHAAFDRQRHLAVLSSQDRTASVVRVPSGEAAGPSMLHEGAVTESTFAPDGTLLTASFDGTVREWDGDTREPVMEPLLHRGPVIWVRSLRDGRIASLGEDQQLRLWRRPAQALVPLQAELGRAVEVSRDGRSVVRLTQDGALQVARIRSAVGAAALEEFRVIAQRDRVTAPYALDADGSAFAWTVDQWLVEWSFGGRTGATMRLPARVRSLEVSRAGGLVAAWLEDGTIRVFDTATARASGLPVRIDASVMAWGLTDDGRYLLLASESALQAFDARTGYPLATQALAGGISADVSRGSAAIAVSTGREIALWQPGTAPARRVPIPALVTAVRFSPDGTRLLSVSVDGRVHVRDAGTLAETGPALRHSNAVLSAQFSPDGQWVVTLSLDATIRIWDPVSGQVVSDPLRVRERTARPLVVGDGNWMAVVGGDGRSIEWRALAIGFPMPLPSWFGDFYGSLSGLASVEAPPAAPAAASRPAQTQAWDAWWRDWKTYVERRRQPPGG